MLYPFMTLNDETEIVHSVWITGSGGCLLQNNNSVIPEKQLRAIMKIIEARCFEIVRMWKETFGSLNYYC